VQENHVVPSIVHINMELPYIPPLPAPPLKLAYLLRQQTRSGRSETAQRKE
jgi:hypothetical protein